MPAPKAGVEAAAAVEERRVGAGRIVRDVGTALVQSMRNWNRKVWVSIGVVVAGFVIYGAGWSGENGGSCPCGFGRDTIRRQAGSSGVVRFFRTFGGFTTGLWKKVGSDTATNPRVGKNFGFSQGGCGGTQEKVRMVESVVQEESTKAKTVYDDYRTSVSRLWLEEAGTLDLEFDAERKKFLEEVEVRAREVGLFYHPEEDEDLQQPEIAANEYRLALYRAPPSIKMPDQFGWIEKTR